MLLVALIGAVLIGLSLGFLGSGGSILTVPVLTFLVGMEGKAAIATSIAIVGLIALFGAIPHIRKKRVDYATLLLFGLPGSLGMYLGVLIANEAEAWMQLATFAVVMGVAAFFMFRPHSAADETDGKPRALGANRILLIASEGLFVGALTGFVGVGGGFLIVPALVLLGGLPMNRAVGTSLLIIALKSVVGVGKHWNNAPDEAIDWELTGLFSAFGIGGTLLAAKLAGRVNNRQLKRIFAWFLVALAPVILIKSLLDKV